MIDTEPGPSPSRVLIPLGLGTAISLLGDSTLYTVLPHASIAASAGVTLTMVGIILGVNRLVRLVSNPIAGSLYDRLPTRKLMIASLFLLGLGWNFCYVGGSTMLTDNLLNMEQSRVQGFNDLLLGLVSAIGSLGSGFVFAAIGYRAVGLIGAALAIIPFLLSLWWRRNHAPRTLRDEVS